MDYCSGGNLEDNIKKMFKKSKGYTTTKILLYLLDISEGLNYLHENNIIHRDLKPVYFIYINYVSLIYLYIKIH